jgi:flagellar basal body rod protein FlgB
MNSGDPSRAQAAVKASGDAAGADGNNVNFASEQAILVKSELHFDALVAALNYKFSTLRAAIKGQ